MKVLVIVFLVCVAINTVPMVKASTSSELTVKLCGILTSSSSKNKSKGVGLLSGLGGLLTGLVGNVEDLLDGVLSGLGNTLADILDVFIEPVLKQLSATVAKILEDLLGQPNLNLAKLLVGLKGLLNNPKVTGKDKQICTLVYTLCSNVSGYKMKIRFQFQRPLAHINTGIRIV